MSLFQLTCPWATLVLFKKMFPNFLDSNAFLSGVTLNRCFPVIGRWNWLILNVKKKSQPVQVSSILHVSVNYNLLGVTYLSTIKTYIMSWYMLLFCWIPNFRLCWGVFRWSLISNAIDVALKSMRCFIIIIISLFSGFRLYLWKMRSALLLQAFMIFGSELGSFEESTGGDIKISVQ